MSLGNLVVRATLSRRPCSLGSGYEVVWNAAVCIKALQTAENVLLLTDQAVEKVGWRSIDRLSGSLLYLAGGRALMVAEVLCAMTRRYLEGLLLPAERNKTL